MKITRIRVPEFRALKNIDITFEPDFTPNIFPLASLNGGGKSTLLQLVFILLKSLDANSEKKNIKYIENLFDFFSYPIIVQGSRVIAQLNIEDELVEYDMEFTFHVGKSIKSEDGNYLKFSPTHYYEYDFSIFQQKIEIQNKIDKTLQLKEKKIQEQENLKSAMLSNPIDIKNINKHLNKLITEQTEILLKENVLRQKLYEQKDVLIIAYFSKDDFLNILTCKLSIKSKTPKSININIDDSLGKIAKNIFLTMPSTQPILFLDRHQKEMLFQDRFDEYQLSLKEAKKYLQGFFTYSFLPVNLIQSFFDKVFNLDIQQAIETKGEYGNQYKQLIEQMNCVLENKIVNISPDRKTINFEMEDENGNTRKLYPEDLSHGELKRLSIYLWLKYYDIKDAVVLMDEIEIAFHPDWQYQIIRDLQEWGASNQYILATHSYELCQALTPAHVKEISPNLLPSQENES